MTLGNWLNSVTRGLNPQQRSIRHRLLNDPYYRLRSAAEIALAASLGVRIDANRATVDDWLRLPGLSIHQARSLVELSRNGVEFHCLEDVAVALGMTAERLKPLEPILTFCFYDAESIYSPQSINPNTASWEILAQIPGIDGALAKTIVEKRDREGVYRDLADFQRRLSLSGNAIGQLMYYLRF